MFETTPHVFTISDIIEPEVLSRCKINNYPKRQLITSIIKMIKGTNDEIEIPSNNSEREETPSNLSKKYDCIVSVLAISNIDYSQAANSSTVVPNIVVGRNYFKPEWIKYPKNQKHYMMSKETLELLHLLYTRGNQDKLHRVIAD